MKKKILSILLIGIMVIGLTGCGNNDSSNTNTSSNDNNTTENNTTTNNITKEENVKEDNQELVDTLNNVVNEFISEAEKDEDDGDHHYSGPTYQHFLKFMIDYEKMKYIIMNLGHYVMQNLLKK